MMMTRVEGGRGLRKKKKPKREREREGREYWQGSWNAHGGEEGATGGTKDYTENISLLEKFFTPLSASIVIYARDEGGYGAAIPAVLDPTIPSSRGATRGRWSA